MFIQYCALICSHIAVNGIVKPLHRQLTYFSYIQILRRYVGPRQGEQWYYKKVNSNKKKKEIPIRGHRVNIMYSLGKER